MKPRGTVGFSFLLPTWLREPLLSIGVAKEVREIFPYWLVSAAVSALWLTGGGGSLDEGMAFVSFLVGELATVAMGAATFGHEFTHRTVSLMLVQPVARRELWQRKMGVLGAAMGTTLLLRLAGPILHGNALTALSFAGLMSVSAILYGLTVAPWLTLVSRSVLAGTVFTVCLPVITYQATSVAVALAYGLDVSNASAMPATLSVFVLLTVLQWIVAPFLGYRAFRRLQATDSRGPVIRLPRLLRRTQASAVTARRGGGALIKLIGKELRLLAPAYVVAGLYLLICGADITIRLLWPAADPGENGSDLVRISSVIYAILVSLLAGCLACAEDRHMGTLLWQLVQPVAAWRQWLVKAGVAHSVSLVLALGLPVLMLGAESALFWPGQFHFPVVQAVVVVLDVIVLCLLGLYVSSLAGSTIRAMLWATPIAFVLAFVLATLGVDLFDSPANHAWVSNWLLPFETEGRTFACPAGAAALILWTLLGIGFFAVPLVCAYHNFRRQDQSFPRVMSHVAVMIGYSVFAMLACLGFAGWCRAAGFTLALRPETIREQQAAQCIQDMDSISYAIVNWILAHSLQLPPHFHVLTDELASPKVLICPADRSHVAAHDWAHWTDTNVTYEFRIESGGPHAPRTAELICPIHHYSRIVWPSAILEARSAVRAGTNAAAEDSARSSTNKLMVSDHLRLLMRYGLLTPKGQRPVLWADPRTGAETFQRVPRTNAPADDEATPPPPAE